MVKGVLVKVRSQAGILVAFDMPGCPLLGNHSIPFLPIVLLQLDYSVSMYIAYMTNKVVNNIDFIMEHL